MATNHITGVKVQALIYAMRNGKLECLCLKRSLQDGGFWHVVTGTVDNNETDRECLVREVREELGISSSIEISPITREWEWDKNGEIFTIREYFAQVPGDSNILLNEEHDEFQWLPLPEAEVLLDKESSKNMVTRLQKYIEEKDG